MKRKILLGLVARAVALIVETLFALPDFDNCFSKNRVIGGTSGEHVAPWSPERTLCLRKPSPPVWAAPSQAPGTPASLRRGSRPGTCTCALPCPRPPLPHPAQRLQKATEAPHTLQLQPQMLPHDERQTHTITWPRTLDSLRWQMGRNSNGVFSVRNASSTCHSPLYLSATSSGGRSVLVLKVHLPS